MSNESLETEDNGDQTIVLLSAILEELKTKNADKRLWDIDDIAQYLGMSKQTIYARIACQMSFPDPIKLTRADGKHCQKRWHPAEVKNWVLRHRAKK